MSHHVEEIPVARSSQALPALVSLIVAGLGQWMQGRITEALLWAGMWAVSWMNCILVSLILVSRLNVPFVVSLVIPGVIQLFSAVEAARYAGRDQRYSVVRGLAGFVTLAALGVHLAACWVIVAG